MEDAETGAVQRKALKLATAVAQQAKDLPTAAPSRRCRMAMTVPGRPLGSVDSHRGGRSSDGGPAYRRRYVAVLGAFLWGARRAKQQRRGAGKKTLRRLPEWISRGLAMQALTARQCRPIILKHYI